MAILTIDGPSGVGKTAIGLELSKDYHLPFLSLGMFYRSMAWACLQGFKIDQIMSGLTWKSVTLPEGSIQILPYFKGRTLDRELFTDPQIELLTAELSQREDVRKVVNLLAQEVARGGVVAEGRSAVEVFPHADVSLYLTADVGERTARQLEEKKRLESSFSEQAVREINLQRDQKDERRKISPLRLRSSQIVWDSTRTCFRETYAGIKRWFDHHLNIQPLTLSIIIPVNNREKHLRHTLEHLKKQTLPSSQFEILVIDDGSTDKSGEVAQEFDVQVIRTSHSGPGAARNKGIEKAHGEVILFLDADILVPSDFLEKVLLLHSRTNNLVLLGARRHLPEHQSSIQSQARLDSREKLLLHHSFGLSHLKHPWSLAYTCNFSVPRHLLQEERFDETFTGWGLEDVEFAYRLYKKGGRFAYSRRVMGYHLYHDRSPSQGRFAAWMKNLELMQAKHSDPAIQAFTIFKDVFDPKIQADYFEAFKRFDPPPQSAEILDLSDFEGDPLLKLQEEWLKRGGSSMRLIDKEEKILYEVYLPFLRTQVIAFFPKEGIE